MVMSPKRKAEVKSIAKVLAIHIALMRLEGWLRPISTNVKTTFGDDEMSNLPNPNKMTDEEMRRWAEGIALKVVMFGILKLLNLVRIR